MYPKKAILLKPKRARTFNATAAWKTVGGKRIYFRSRWEYLFALNLQWQLDNKIIESWEYEPKTFWFESIKRGVRSYKPDFRVTMAQGLSETAQGSTIWYEVKGFMDKRSKTKLARFKRFYPNERLIVVGKEWFKKNSVKVNG